MNARNLLSSLLLATAAFAQETAPVVVKVLDALKQAGIQDVPAFTQPEPGKP